MKKLLSMMTLALLMCLSLVGCSSETEEVKSNVEKTVDTSDKADAEEKESESDTDKDDVIEVNKEVANDDNFRAELIDVKKIKDDIFGNSIEIKFELENKMDQKVEVQAREVSSDGKMVDETILSMSQEITPGKIADGVLTISEFEGYTLPELKENLEMKLHVFSWDDMDFQQDYPVEISFN